MLRKWLKYTVSLYAKSLYEVSNALNRDNALRSVINFVERGNLKKAGAAILLTKIWKNNCNSFLF
jgi:hypothetical protein